MYNRDIQEAIKVLKSGGIILYPSDTIWGIGCDCSNADAIRKVYEIKKRADEKSMILLADSIQMVERYVEVIPEIAYQIVEFSTSPLTIIYPRAKLLPKNLVAQDGSIAIRISNEEFSNELVFRHRKPIVSTSANISGEKAPDCFIDISEEIKNSVDYIVGYQQNDLSKSKPSGIIKLGPTGEVKVIRE